MEYSTYVIIMSNAVENYRIIHPFPSLQVKDEKESIERELVKKVSELQQQIATTQQERKRAEQLTSSYDGQMKKLKELHCQCQEEAGKLKALLETKEAELSRMLTALQISAAQVSLIPPPPYIMCTCSFELLSIENYCL